MIKNQEKMIMLISNSDQLTYREIDGKMVLSAWINFFDLKKLSEIMGYNYLFEGRLKVILLYDCIYIEDLTDYLDYLGFDEEEINKIKEKYKE